MVDLLQNNPNAVPLSSVSAVKTDFQNLDREQGFISTARRQFDNTVSKAALIASNLLNEEDPQFDKMSYYKANYGDDDTFLEDYMTLVDNYQDALAFDLKVETEKDLNRVAGNSSVLPALAGSIVGDPVAMGLMLMGGGAAKVGAKITSGASRAALVGGAVGSEALAFEMFERSADPTRSALLSTAVVGGSTVLGALTGVPFNKMPKVKGAAIKPKEWYDKAQGLVNDTISRDRNVTRTVGVGAAEVDGLYRSGELEFYSRYGMGETAGKQVSKLSPRERLFNISSDEGKELLAGIQNPTSDTIGTMEGRGVQASVYDWMRATRQKFDDELTLPLTNLANEAADIAIAEFGVTGRLVNRFKARKKAYEDITFAAIEGNAEDLAANTPYEKKIREAAILQQEFYNDIAGIAEKEGIKGFSRRKDYAGIVSFDSAKITPENSIDFLNRVRADILEWTKKSVAASGNKVDQLDSIRIGFIQESAGFADTSDELFDFWWRNGGGAKGRIHMSDELSAELDDILLHSKMAREEADSLLRKADEAHEAWADQLNKHEDLEGLIDAYAHRILDNVRNGDALGATQATEQLSGAIPRFFKERMFDPRKYREFIITNPHTLNSYYAKRFGAKRGMQKVFKEQDPQKVFKRYQDLSDKKLEKVRQLANALDEGDESKIKMLKGQLEDTSFGRFIEKNGLDKKSLMEFYERYAADTNKAIKMEARDLLKRLEGGMYADTYQKLGPVMGGILRGADLVARSATFAWNTVNSVTEVFAPVFAHGFEPIVPQIKNVTAGVMRDVSGIFNKDARKMATSLEGMSSGEVGEYMARQTGTIMQWAVHKAVGDLIAEAGNFGEASMRFSGVYETAMRSLYTMNGLAWFSKVNTNAVTLTSDMMVYNLLNDVAKGTATPKRTAHLARLGISEIEAKDFLRMYDEAGARINTKDGITFTDFSKLDDDMAQRWRMAVRRDVDNIILNPNEGDIAHVNSHPVAKLMLMYKSWPQMATQRYLKMGIQHADAQTFANWAFMTSVGMVSTKLSAGITGYDSTGEDFVDWMYSGMERAGFFGLTHELGLNYMAKQSGVDGGGAKFSGGDLLEDTVGVPAMFFRAAEDARTFGDNNYHLKRMMPGSQVMKRLGVMDR